MSFDTQDEIKKQKEALARAEAALPLLFETEIGGKKYRIRGAIVRGDVSVSVCEWLFRGDWRKVRNFEIMDRLKDIAVKSGSTCLDNDVAEQVPCVFS